MTSLYGDTIYNIYYWQSNLFCIALFLLIRVIHNRHSKYNTTETVFLKHLIDMTVIYCVADILAWGVNGRLGILHRILLYTSNMVYVSMPMMLVVAWLGLVYYKLDKHTFEKSLAGKLINLPCFIMIFLVFSSPLTGFAFWVDENNVYHRALGAYLIPVVAIGYMIYATLLLAGFFMDEKNKMKRDEIFPMFFFPLPIVMLGLLQVFIYGLTVNQLGMAFAVVMIFLDIQYNKMSVDELTGLNNRREFKQYLNGVFNSSNTRSIFVCMIDVDFFKTINDTYGHLEGDEALKVVAGILKKVCGMQSQRVFLARYGGDEFVIAGVNYKEEELKTLKDQVREASEEWGKTSNKPYKLTLSVGGALAEKETLKGFEELISKADEYMYEVKKNRPRR